MGAGEPQSGGEDRVRRQGWARTSHQTWWPGTPRCGGVGEVARKEQKSHHIKPCGRTPLGIKLGQHEARHLTHDGGVHADHRDSQLHVGHQTAHQKAKIRVEQHVQPEDLAQPCLLIEPSPVHWLGYWQQELFMFFRVTHQL